MSIVTPPALASYGCWSNATLSAALIVSQAASVTLGTPSLTATSVDFVLSANDPLLCQSYCTSVSANLLVPQGNGTLFYMNGNHCSCYDFYPKVDGLTTGLNAAFIGSSLVAPLTLPFCAPCSAGSTYLCGNSNYGAATSLASVYAYSNLRNSVAVTGSSNKLLDCATGYRRSYDNSRCIPSCSGMPNSLGVPVGSTVPPLTSSFDICQCQPGYAYIEEKCQLNRLVGHSTGYLASETYRGCLTSVDTSSFTNISTSLRSPSRCLNFCASSNNAYAFIGYPPATSSSPSVLTCGCSNSQSGVFNDPVSKCTTICPESTHVCGDSTFNAFDFYTITTTPNKLAPYTPNNSQNSSVSTATTNYIGCYNSITPAALLSPSLALGTSFSVQDCQRACAKDSLQTALVRNSNECKCLKSIFNTNLGTGSTQNSLFNKRNAICNVTCSASSSLSCGGVNSYDVYSTTYGFVPTTIPIVPSALTTHEIIPSTVNPTSNLDLSYAGCATIPAFTAAAIPFGISMMTLELCAAACDTPSGQYSFFAVKTGSACFCGSALPNIPPPSTPPVCNKLCNGNPAQYCGSSADEASVYNLQYVAPAFLASNNMTASASYNLSVSTLGCYAVTSSRIASNGLFIDSKQTVSLCQNSCLQAGFFYSGVTNSDTCLCSSGVSSADVFSQVALPSKCTSKCVGNPGQTCGDSLLQYANVYKTEVVPTVVKDLVVDAMASPYSFTVDSGKWADDKTSLLSAFCGSPNLQTWTSAQVMYSTLLTPESCSKYCLAQYPGSSLSAVFSTAPASFSTCACGPYSALASVATAKGKCNASCPGNNQLACGRQADSTVATISVLSHPGLASTTSISPFDASVNVTVKHAGCFALPAKNNLQPPPDVASISISDTYACAADCFSNGLVYGFQQGTKCLCSSTLPAGAILSSSPEVDCNTVCLSNTQVTCGGSVNFDVVTYAQSYNTAPVNVTTPAKAFRLASKTGHAANIAYAGCFATASLNGETPPTGDYMADKAPVALTGIIASSLMTSKRCITACDQSNSVGAKQYAAAMLTSGNQCLCLSSVPSSSAAVTGSDICNLPCGGSASETCGDAVNGQLYALNYETAVTMDTPYKGTDLPKTQYAGCYLGDTKNFQLNKGNAPDMTVAYCVQACASSKFAYAALQKGNSCFCSASIANVTSAFRFPDSCKLPCSGNDQVSCGDLRNVNVYYTALPTDNTTLNYTVPVRVSSPLAPYVFTKAVVVNNSSSSGSSNGSSTLAKITVTSSGCFSSDQAAFLQYSQAAVSSKMTVQTCASLCANATSNVYAGLMNSDTCMCGASMPVSFSNGVSKCTYSCSGDATTSCGDNNYLNIYKLNSDLASSASATGASSEGIFVPSASISGSSGISASASVSGSAFASVPASSSVSASVSYPTYASSQGASSFLPSGASASVEMSGSVSDSISLSSSPSSVGTSSSTTSSSSSSLAVTSTSSTTSSTQTSSSTSQQPIQSAAIVRSYTSGNIAWSYKSCWGEPLPHTLTNRALGTHLIASGASVQTCLDAATSRGFTYAGIEYGGECWGSNVSPKGGSIEDSYCNMPCKSSPSQFCGGDWTLSLYAAPTVPKNKPVVAVGNARFYYSSCWGEPRVGRALTVPINNNVGGTIESCLALGLQAGYSLCGLEYGGECWCSKGSLYGGAIEQKYCNMPCKGNASQICGGGNALSLYGRG